MIMIMSCNRNIMCVVAVAEVQSKTVVHCMLDLRPAAEREKTILNCDSYNLST